VISDEFARSLPVAIFAPRIFVLAGDSSGLRHSRVHEPPPEKFREFFRQSRIHVCMYVVAFANVEIRLAWRTTL
jgi:hypothetical protein